MRTTMAVVLLGAVYGLAGAAAARPALDEDLWWHLAVGRWVVEHGAVPRTDPLRATDFDRPWVAYSWLFEVVLYGVYAAAGLTGVVALRIGLTLAVVAALHCFVARRERRLLPTLLLLFAAVIVLMPLTTERPWLLSIVFTTWTLGVVLDVRAGSGGRGRWLLPLVFVVWANVHIPFVYGLLVLGLGCLGASGRRLVPVALACLAATLATPYHVRLYGVVLEYATQPGPFRVIQELTAPGFRDVWDWTALGLALAAAFALGRRPRLDPFEILLLGVTAYLAFRARRDLWLVMLAALALLTADRRAQGDDAALAWTPPRIVGLAALVGVLLVAALWRRDVSPESIRSGVADKFPAEAAAFVDHERLPGPLLAPLTWGGYLLWRLPDVPANIDGRTNLHGDARLLRLEATWAGLPGWDADPELQRASLVIAHPRLALTELLRRDARFECRYEDAVAVVFVRRD